jgi:thiosulfate/3-mercaptopyruvate sulfurtransferase
MGKSLSLLVGAVLVLLTMECNRGLPEDRGILVSTDWLQSRLNDPQSIVLHAGTQEGYDSLHIPGARLIFPGDFVVTDSTLRNELPAMDSIVHLLRKAGVNKDSRIILCYESDRLLSRTARVYLTLVHAGLAGQTHVLNGGMPAWIEEGRETTDSVPIYAEGNLEALAPVEVVISASDLEKERWSPGLVVIDARTEEEYHGTPATEEEGAEGGHVEGAYALPYQATLVDGKPYLFKSDAELETLFRESGMDPDRTTVVYCGSGIRASVSYLTASHLGYPVLLYDGSYEEWDRLNLPLTGAVDPPVKMDLPAGEDQPVETDLPDEADPPVENE